MKKSAIQISHLSPMLPVSDMEATLSYYADTLGFNQVWRWDEPTTVANTRREDCAFLFTLDPAKHRGCRGLEIMVFLHGIQNLWQEYGSQGVDIEDPLEEKPWGLWEFVVKDINGYYLRFAEG